MPTWCLYALYAAQKKKAEIVTRYSSNLPAFRCSIHLTWRRIASFRYVRPSVAYHRLNNFFEFS
jgi:hypothetical protein